MFNNYTPPSMHSNNNYTLHDGAAIDAMRIKKMITSKGFISKEQMQERLDIIVRLIKGDFSKAQYSPMNKWHGEGSLLDSQYKPNKDFLKFLRDVNNEVDDEKV